MGGGQSGKSTTTNAAQPLIDPTVQPLVASSAEKFLQAQNQAPDLATLLSPSPQQIPGQTPVEQLLASLQLGVATPANPLDATSYATSPEQDALSQIAQLTGGPIGSSPATLEAIKALETQYTQQTQPTIQNQMMLAGLGNSGALGESLARARSGVSAAEVPLFQQEIQDRMNAVNALSGIGGTLAQRQAGDVSTALQTAGTPREIQTQQQQAQFLDTQRIQAMIEQLVMGPLNIWGPSLIGQAGSTLGSTSTKGSGIAGALLGGGSTK